MTIGQLMVIVGADISSLDKGLDNALNKTNKTAAGFTALGSTITKAVTLPIGLLAAGVLTAAVQMDSLRRGLMAMAGSAEETERQLTELREVAKLPGLGFKEAIQGSIRLQAVGMSSAVAARALKAFGNAVALTGGGKGELDRVTVQLGQMAAKSKILTQDLRPIIEAAPAVAKALKDAFGTVNPEDINKLGFSTKQFFDKLLTSLEKLPQMTGGARNSMENFQDSLFRASATIGNTVLPALTPLIDKLTALLNTVDKTNPELLKNVVVSLAIAAAIGPLILLLAGAMKAYTLLTAAVVLSTTGMAAFEVVMTRAAFSFVAAGGGLKGLSFAIATMFAAIPPGLILMAALAAAVWAAKAVFDNWTIIMYELQPALALVHKYWAIIVDAVQLGVAKITIALAAVRKPVDDVVGFFRNMWTKVVGQSYVPDMVVGIGTAFAKLHKLMVVPTQKANDAVIESFARTAKNMTPQQEQLIALLERQEQVMRRIKSIELDREFEKNTKQLAALNVNLKESQTELGAIVGKLEALAGVREEILQLTKASEQWVKVLQFAFSLKGKLQDTVQETTQPVQATGAMDWTFLMSRLKLLDGALADNITGFATFSSSMRTLKDYADGAGSALFGAGKSFLKSAGNLGLKLLSMFNPLSIVASALDEAFRNAGTALEPFVKAVGEIAKVILTALQPVFESLVPVIRDLAPIIGAVAQIFGVLFKAVGPILHAMLPLIRALFPILKFAAIMLTYLGQAFTKSAQIILKIAQFIAIAVGTVIRGIFGALAKIPLIGGAFKPLANFGQELIDIGNAFGESAADFGVAFDELGKAREEIKGIEILEPIAADAALSVGELGTAAASAAGALDTFAAANNTPPRGASGAMPIEDGEMSTQPALVLNVDATIMTSGDGEETYANFYDVLQEKARAAGTAARQIAQALPAPAR